MGRSNLIPITRIYDIYPKYTYSDSVKKFMDEIVDIDRANVYTKEEVIVMLTELKEQLREMHEDFFEAERFDEAYGVSDSMVVVQQKINELKGESEGV